MVTNLLTLKEAASVLGVSANTLRKWDQTGRLKAVRIGKRRDRRYRSADVETMTKISTYHWQEYIRNGLGYRTISPVVDGFLTHISQVWGFKQEDIMIYGRDQRIYFYYNIADVQAFGSKLVDRAYQKDAKHIFAAWQKVGDSLIALSEKVLTADLKKWSLSKLRQTYKLLTDLTANQYGYSLPIDAIDEIGQVVLEKIIRLTAAQHHKPFNETYNILTTPNQLSEASQREYQLLLLAQDCKNNVITTQKINQKLTHLAEEYWWLDINWGSVAHNALPNLRKSLDELITLPSSKLKERLDRLKANVSQIRAKLIHQLELETNKEFQKYLAVVDIFAPWHEYRKKCQMKSAFAETSIIKELSVRTSIPLEVFDWASPDEVGAIAAGRKVSITNIYQRSMGYLILIKKGLVERYFGNEAEKIWVQEKDQGSQQLSDLQGIGASIGKVVGEAFVALSPQEANDIKPGQILVTAMTTPEFVSAMKKAAAIITDEGGITCHAAIISRELGIPCIVSTKNATRLLKNGQKIEVAANHGVVRIL